MSVTLQDHVSYPTYLSYLSDRKRQVFIDGVQSDFCNVTCGIPQGSILGPLLFTIYINDLPSCNLFSKPRMYADDTTLTTSAEDPCVLEHKMNYDMNLIQSWLSANKLTLNVKKTKYMLIGSQFKLSQINSDFTVKVNNTPLERVIKHKSLGVQIDESLNWRPHINTISKKISAGIAFLEKRPGDEVVCLSLWLRQIIDLLAADKTRYFAQPRPIIVNYYYSV